MVAEHIASRAEARVAGIALHRSLSTPVGVIHADRTGRITASNPDQTQGAAGPEVAASYASIGKLRVHHRRSSRGGSGRRRHRFGA